ncbi:MAG: DUF2956 domain-containing protein [Motiliproteus sp.]
MSQYSKKDKNNPQPPEQATEKTKTEAMALARNIQKPGQTKEQTKLIAQGIQKGIALYKKQQKSKARDLDKRLKKAAGNTNANDQVTDNDALAAPTSKGSASPLPWLLLACSWAGFIGYQWLNANP